jgi:N-sulfoglucosamine sulfohydrolase
MDRPNIIWLVAEDMCANLGCFGSEDSKTPHLDEFARSGVRFTNAFSLAPICAPARSCLISGMYPSTLGSHHMRSSVKRPASIRCFPEYLREAGYFCINGYGSKEQGYHTKFDYNFAKPQMTDPLPVWDEVNGFYPKGKQADWNNRTADQPFFAQIGFFITHSSQYGRRKSAYGELIPFRRVQADDLRDPSLVTIPGYHVDSTGSRELWSEYHECITEMDYQVGEVLEQLKQDGLEEDTIVFFFGDNGMGVPGGKSWLWEQGIHIPLIIRCPEKYRHLLSAEPGGLDERMISFEDFAPTVLRLAGIEIPAHMQGRPFLGEPVMPERSCAYGIRDRHDHSYDIIRTVRDKRYHYNRNFMPHLDWMHVVYMWNCAPGMMEDWKNAAKQGGLEGRQRCFFTKNKPMEELYDMQKDPDQMRNLAGDPDYMHVLQRMRQECKDWMIRTNDLGLLSEYEMHERAKASTPYEIGSDRSVNNVEKLIAAADIANRLDPAYIPQLIVLLQDSDSAVRRWGAIGLSALKEQAVSAKAQLLAALQDSSADVRIIAAEALCQLGCEDDAYPVLASALEHQSGFVKLTALWTLDRIGNMAERFVEQIRGMEIRGEDDWTGGRQIGVMIDLIAARFGAGEPRREPVFSSVDLSSIREKYYD